MPRYGYARVSSTDQDCALQEARPRDEGGKVIRTEKASGKSRDGRDELARIMDFLHAGDERVVVKLDRLALQLHVPFQVCVLCGGLMSAPPSRPSNDEGWLNAPLRQSDRYAPDFRDRPGTLQACRWASFWGAGRSPPDAPAPACQRPASPARHAGARH